MNYLLRKLLAQSGYMDQAGDGTGGAAGGAGDGGQGTGDAGQGAAGDAGDGDKGGKKGPTDEEARLLKENMKRKEELRKAGEEKASLEAKLKQFEGIDPDAIRKLLEDQKSAESKALEAKGDWDRLKTRMSEEHTREMGSVKQQLEALQSTLGQANNTINELSIGSKFGQSQFISEELTLTPGKARVIYGDHFDLVDGEVVGYDKPRGAANRTAIVDQYGNSVAFEDAMRKIVEADPEKDHMLKSKIKPGAGSDTKKPSGSSANASKQMADTTSIGKIAQGLASLKVATNGSK
jgi:hypothetical protein